MIRVAVLGPGLLGGSIALALRADPLVEVRLWARRSAAVDEARALKIANLATDNAEEAVTGADIVVVCVPIGAMAEVLKAALPGISPSALVTDVGSVKKPVCDILAPLLTDRALFVGSHPMAGSEKAGISAARPDLFIHSVCIVTPESGRTPPVAIERAQDFWSRLGCRVRSLPPQVHDEVCSLISHLPHLVAAALVQNVEAILPEAFGFCGTGFRDTTRIASGLPEMWTEILGSNRAAVAANLRSLIGILQPLAAHLERGGTDAEKAIRDFLTSGKKLRDGLSPGTNF
jgi:prephenate dehydrogenase